MKYLVDLTPQTIEAIKKLLNNGSHESVSQFVSAAIENQIALENNETNEFMSFETVFNNIHPPLQKSKASEGNLEKYKIQNISSSFAVVNAPEYKDLVFASQEIPEDKAWIWGQINKILPVKIGLRVLHQLLSNKDVVELNEFLETAAKIAVGYGNLIRDYELRNKKMRGEKISAALPSDDEKSQSRYKFQFMAYLRKDGLLDGAMAVMRFCNIISEKKNGKAIIGLTEAGKNFSSINNPVLDNNDFEISLSREESDFYLEHIKENVKGEYEAIKFMLGKINSDVNDRDGLTKEIERNFGNIWEATDAVINTQRAGLTARMFELGLIEKEKDGIYVRYKLSEVGKKHLNNQ